MTQKDRIIIFVWGIAVMGILLFMVKKAIGHGDGCRWTPVHTIRHIDLTDNTWAFTTGNGHNHAHQAEHDSNPDHNFAWGYKDYNAGDTFDCDATAHSAPETDNVFTVHDNRNAVAEYATDRHPHITELQNCLNDNIPVADDCNLRWAQRSPLCCELVTNYLTWLAAREKQTASAPTAPRTKKTITTTWAALKKDR